jgi:DNA-binding NtrC family response regulator
MGDRILVVDDESGIREGLRRLLEAWGYHAETAASADDALSRIEKERPSAVITDLVMPGIDGLEFVRRLRAVLDPGHRLLGQGTIEAAVEAIKLGAQDFLEKPVEPAKLKILLEKLAGARELLARTAACAPSSRARRLRPLRGQLRAIRTSTARSNRSPRRPFRS